MKDFKATTQNIRLIELEECVPTAYQRPTNDRQVDRIVKSFDEAKLGALTVSFRDGKYHILDGLHRSKALKALGYTHALCLVLTGLTYEDEAERFRGQNENKRIIAAFDDFSAGLEAKDEECVRISEIVSANRFKIGRGRGFYRIGAIRALFSIVRDYGYDVLSDTLLLLSHTWSGAEKATESECLLGVAEFVSRYGLCDFAERMKEKFIPVMFDYAEAMRFRGASRSNTSRKKFCRILVEHYNKGLNGMSKKRLVWEE